MKIAIDLLPPEFRAEEYKRAKFYKIQTAGVAVILFTVFLSSLTVALRILQSQDLSKLQSRVTQAEEKITGQQNTQVSLLLLKNRLSAINQYLGAPSRQAEMYRLIDKLLPQSAFVSSISVDKTGGVLILATVPDEVALDDLTNSLISPETNQDKIGQVSLESINRGKDGTYRVSLKIKPK